jgi:uncharacterized protein (TIGR04551 family)
VRGAAFVIDRDKARRLGPKMIALALTVAATTAQAQMMGPGGGFGSPGGMGPPPAPGKGGGGADKEEGPAEEAPEEVRPTDLEPLPGYVDQGKRKLQIFELDGYLRLRSDYLYDFFLGQGYTNVPNGATGAQYGLPPFPRPLDCPGMIDAMGQPFSGTPTSTGTEPNNPGRNCGHKNQGGANLRFRLEPTINVTDQVRVHSQIDILDNTIMGSTPDSLAGIEGYNRPSTAPTTTAGSSSPSNPMSLPGVAPAPVLSNSQYPPEVGQNGFFSSIRAKRAWAEVDGEFGSIRFGRMPWNWGRGMFYNSGACADCDVGTTVDRVMGLTTVYGHQLAAAWDLGAQGQTTQSLTLGRNDPGGYQYDLAQNDDVLQLMASITKIDNPIDLREKLDRGDIVVNYGLQLVYRNQGYQVYPQNTPLVAAQQPPAGSQPQSPDQLPQARYVGALIFTPDIWFKLHYKALTVEFEGIGVFGRITHPGPLAVDDQKLTIRQWGFVAASELRLYRDAFFVGLQTGGASGDQAEEPGQYLNYRWRFVRQPSGDHTLADFHFSPDYHVDEIFFRHILGTVTNAIYIKPQTAYWFDLGQSRSLGLNGSVIYSMAQVPVSTPGNNLVYGLETDLGAGYRNTAEGFYAGFTWGVFWPLGALDRGAVWDINQRMDASVAQILRIYMGVKF